MEGRKGKFTKGTQYLWDPKFARSVVILTRYEMNYNIDLFHRNLIRIH